MYAPRLKKGDEIRVISPARSLSFVRKDIFHNALQYLQEQGYRVTFSAHGEETEYANSASIESRVKDLHDAFADPNVKAVLASIGGFNANQILEYIDYSTIQKNPKILCGFSDITALLNAVYAKTGLVTYHGPFFCSFGIADNRNYTNEYFEKCVASDKAYTIVSSAAAGKYTVIQEGSCEGTIIGGNLCTLNLLQGTPFMPSLRNVVLFLEDDNIMGDYFVPEFERNLQSLLQVTESKIVGIVFGRFSEDCRLTTEVLTQIVRSKKQLKDIPILFNADFGHVFPFFTFPIGGKAKIVAQREKASITIHSTDMKSL